MAVPVCGALRAGGKKGGKGGYNNTLSFKQTSKQNVHKPGLPRLRVDRQEGWSASPYDSGQQAWAVARHPRVYRACPQPTVRSMAGWGGHNCP